MLIYILLAITSGISSLTYFKKYCWEGESLDTKKTYLILSITLFGVVFPIGVLVIIAYSLVYVLSYLSEKSVKLIDKF